MRNTQPTNPRREPEQIPLPLGETLTIQTLLVHRCGQPLGIALSLAGADTTMELNEDGVLHGVFSAVSHELQFSTRKADGSTSAVRHCPQCQTPLPKRLQMVSGKKLEWYRVSEFPGQILGAQ